MAGNQVMLEFAGDSSKLEQTGARVETALDGVGQAARDMDRQARASGDGFDRVGEAADDVDTKAMGFRDTLTGIEDGTKGVKMAMDEGLGIESMLLMATGVGDLGSAFYNFLIPSLKSAVGWLAQTRVGILVAAGATKLWAGVQAVFNAIMLLNPIVLIIVAIIALIAVIVLIATKTTWFQDLWAWTWSKIGDTVKSTWEWIKRFSTAALNNLTSIPGRIRSAFAKVGSFISAPFRAGFNAVRAAWNNTIGGKGFSIPSWVPPPLGGQSFRIPTFHTGGIGSGAMGSEFLAVLKAGERVTPTGGGNHAEGRIVGEVVIRGDQLVVVLREAIGHKGGDPVKVLTPR